MTQAIALAATSIGGLMVAANTSVAREYHAGLSAMLGVHAALAAKKGYVAEEHVLEMPRGFFSAYGGDHLEDVTKHLGASWDITTNMAIKLVPGGHPHHAAAEAAANAAIAGDVDPLDVSSIVLSSAKYRTLPGPKHPTDLIGVAHSPAYFVAAAIADRGYGWVHACPEKVVDPVIARLIDKIAVDPNPTPYPDRFAHHHGATVTITLGTAAGSPTTWIFRAAPLPAESIGPTWTPSTGNWCRCQGWRRKKSRPASRWCIASTPSRTCQSSRACYADGPQSAPPIELAPWACPATAGPSLPKRSMKEHEYGWDLER
jgi:2-methylcitrate dehydratase PrpD